MLHPRHRGDCSEFFRSPHLTESVQLDALRSTVSDIEHAAAKAGRTWSEQLTYILEVCLGKHLLDFDDPRSTEDWRMLMTPCRLRWSGMEEWYPCEHLWRRTP